MEFINENTGWACGENSILKTTNGGINWEDQWNLQLMNFTSISCYGESNIWAVGNSDTALGGIVYKSLNGGINWIRVFDSNVSVNIISTNIPDYFELFQNYPNPFNPVTKIKFDIKKDEGSGTQDVKLIIYDALGKQLQVLINDKLNAGSYESEFDGSDFVSGVYFYKLEAGDFVETKRMILLK